METDILSSFEANLLPDNSRVLLYNHGRSALFSILKGIEIKKGGKVLIPALTCEGVPSAIIAAGLFPIYLEVDTWGLWDEEQVIAFLEENSEIEVIIVQYTFGIFRDYTKLFTYCSGKGLKIILNLSHSYSPLKHIKSLYPLVCFSSAQWNKPFSIGEGGLVITNCLSTYERFRFEHNRLKKVSLWIEIFHLLLEQIRNTHTYWTLKSINQLKAKITKQSSFRVEKLNFFKTKKAYLKLKEISEIDSGRSLILNMYLDALGGPQNFYNQPLLYFPVRVKNKHSLLKKAKANGIEIHDWPVSNLSPLIEGEAKLFYNKDQFPISSLLAEEIISLPTYNLISTKRAREIIDFMKLEAEMVIL